MSRILFLLTFILATNVGAWSQKTSTNNAGFREITFIVNGLVSGKDKSVTFPFTSGQLIIACEKDLWGRAVAVKFKRSATKVHDSAYFLAEDSKERNRWGYRVEDGAEIITLANYNPISETEIELCYHEDKTIEATFNMWNDEDDVPFVEFHFKGKCDDWQSIKLFLCASLPVVAEELIDPN